MNSSSTCSVAGKGVKFVSWQKRRYRSLPDWYAFCVEVASPAVNRLRTTGTSCAASSLADGAPGGPGGREVGGLGTVAPPAPGNGTKSIYPEK